MSRKNELISSVASCIDHTLLKANAKEKEMISIGQEVQKFGFASACIPSAYIRLIKDQFPNIKSCSVLSFPFGYSSTEIKHLEAKSIIASGADELDIVCNIGHIKSGKWAEIQYEMELLNDYVHSENKIVKWIFETAYLEDDEIKKMCELCNLSAADFAKTSTGFAHHGATIPHVELMRSYLDDQVQIKASGGIRTLKDVRAYLNAGATRIGSSSGKNIILEYKQELNS